MTGQPVLAMHAIRKSFGSVTVLKGVDFAVAPGEIHALMGENGAGKSTLMKIAGGIYTDYEGEIAVDGQPVRFAGTRDATRHGVGIIHQELNLVPGMTVADNIFLGAEQVRGGCFVDRRAQLRAAAELLAPLNFRAAPSALVGALRVGEQQLVEIAKALSLHTRILIMDEPTSALSVAEAERLHAIIRRLAGEGVAIVYISHRMEEIFELCGAVTVLRDGALVGTVPIAATSRAELIRMMAGREVQEFFHRGEAVASAAGSGVAGAAPVLSVRGLWLANPKPTPLRPRLVDGVDLDVAAGEVVGLAGLMGAGRTELLETLFGARDEASGGEVRIDGRLVRIGSPLAAKRAGLALVTEDRKRDGLVLEAPIEGNLMLTVMRAMAVYGLVRRSRSVALALRTIKLLAIRANGPGQVAGTLSGGNQQKVVIGKWLSLGPKILLLDEPTRGVDVGAKQERYLRMEQLAESGVAILFASSEMEEILGMSDRTLVMHEGAIRGELPRERLTEENVMRLATGG